MDFVDRSIAYVSYSRLHSSASMRSNGQPSGCDRLACGLENLLRFRPSTDRPASLRRNAIPSRQSLSTPSRLSPSFRPYGPFSGQRDCRPRSCAPVRRSSCAVGSIDVGGGRTHMLNVSASSFVVDAAFGRSFFTWLIHARTLRDATRRSADRRAAKTRGRTHTAVARISSK